METKVHRSACPLDCPDTCGMELAYSGKQLERVRGVREHDWSKGTLCAKTSLYGELVHAPERLLKPLVKEAGGFVEATWDDALARIARRMEGIDGADVLSLNYAGNMGLVQRRFPLRLMHALGATFHDGGVCDASAARGYELVMGKAIGPDLEVEMDPDRCDAFVLWGSDAKRTAPHLMQRLKRLCSAGIQVVVIDIYRTETIARVEEWGGRGLILAPGSDGALALGLAALAFEERAVDLASLKKGCVGAAELRAELAGAWPLERIQRETELERDQIRALADLLFGSEAPLVRAGIGFARRRNGGESMRSVATLMAVLGAPDRLFFQSGDHYGLDADPISRAEIHPEPARPKVSQVGLGAILDEGAFRAAFVWGHNPAATLPDANRVRRGLERDDLFVVVHELFMTETAQRADVVLPATALPEHSDLFRSYGHRSLQVSWRAAAPRGEARSNVNAFSAIGLALGFRGESGFPDQVTGPLFEAQEDALVGSLLAANRSRFSDDEYRRVLAGEPVKLSPRDGGHRGTPSGRVELVSELAAAEGAGRVPTYRRDDGAGMSGTFQLISAPSTATHNSTYLHLPRHRNRIRACAVLHPADAASIGAAEGDPVRLSSEFGSLTLPARIDESAPRKSVRVDGFVDESEVPEGTCVNALTSPDVSDLGAGNVLYSARVEVEPAH